MIRSKFESTFPVATHYNYEVKCITCDEVVIFDS